MAKQGIHSLEQLAVIPQQVWNRFYAAEGLSRVECFRFLNPIKQERLAEDHPQEVVDRQRQNFKRLINELFPADEVEEFVTRRLRVDNFPALSRFDMNDKFSHVCRDSIQATRRLKFDSFNLQTIRGPYPNRGYFDAPEIDFSIRLVNQRPAIILGILFFRKFLVEYALLMQKESRKVLPEEWQPSFDFFFGSWNQNAFIKVMYPAIAMHLHHHGPFDHSRVEEPALDRELMKQVMTWLTLNHAFWGKAVPRQHGHDSKISCAAAGFLSHGIGKRGWINLVFDKIVEMKNDRLMVNDIRRVLNHGRLLSQMIAGR